MFRWYHELAGNQRRTLWACFAGWGLDMMDVQMFSFMMPTLALLWHLPHSQISYLSSASIIATGIGGWIGGFMADRVGRVRVMQLTILWFAGFSFVGGFAQSYDQLLAVRVIQGLGFGGEWGAGAVLIGEIITAQHRGKALGWVQSGYGAGWLMATLLSTAAFLWLPPDLAWRSLMWAGVLPALLVIFIRRNVTEPKIFREQKMLDAAAHRSTRWQIFAPPLLPRTLLASLVAFGVIAAGTEVAVWLPSYLTTTLKLSIPAVGIQMTALTLGSFVGFVLNAYTSDWLGRRPAILLFVSIGAVIIASYMFLPLPQGLRLLLSFPFGVFASGTYSTLGPFFTELFPTSVRASGQSFAYNVGKLGGAGGVALVGYLADRTFAMGHAVAVVALCCFAVAIVATLALPETRGKQLEEVK